MVNLRSLIESIAGRHHTRGHRPLDIVDWLAGGEGDLVLCA